MLADWIVMKAVLFLALSIEIWQSKNVFRSAHTRLGCEIVLGWLFCTRIVFRQDLTLLTRINRLDSVSSR